jgi:hypothetical protein
MLLQHGMIPSMSRPGNPYDNAKCERFMKTLKQEEIRCFEYRDLEDLRANLSVFFDRYYNATRLHSALRYRSPEEFERWATHSKIAEIPEAPPVEFFEASGDLSIRCEILNSNGSGQLDRSPSSFG